MICIAPLFVVDKYTVIIFLQYAYVVLCLSNSSSKAWYNWQNIKISTRYWHDRKRDKMMAKNVMGVKDVTQLELPKQCEAELIEVL